jgi:phosphopantetheine--protein transferase-like protein
LANPKIRIGTDIVEIRRFKQKYIENNLTFYKSIFTKSELKYCSKYLDPYPHLAGIFAAKESVIKCLDRPLRMSDIEVSRDINGKPIAITHYKKKTTKVQISISHTRSVAVAVAISLHNYM